MNHNSYLYIAETLSTWGKGLFYINIIFVSILCSIFFYYRVYTQQIINSQHLASVDLYRKTISLKYTWLFYTFWVLGTYINQTLKWALHDPRPWWIDTHISPLGEHISSGFGMPSGHAQSACGIYILLSVSWLFFKNIKTQEFMKLRFNHQSIIKLWVMVFYIMGMSIMCIWPIIMAWSRVYLRAHTIEQVCCGLMLGIVLLRLLYYSEKNPRQGFYLQGIITLICTILFIKSWYYGVKIPLLWQSTLHSHLPQQFPTQTPSIIYPSVTKCLILLLGLIPSFLYLMYFENNQSHFEQT
jgi:membrane-associated phospholipid phosphatase